RDELLDVPLTLVAEGAAQDIAVAGFLRHLASGGDDSILGSPPLLVNRYRLPEFSTPIRVNACAVRVFRAVPIRKHRRGTASSKGLTSPAETPIPDSDFRILDSSRPPSAP